MCDAMATNDMVKSKKSNENIQVNRENVTYDTAMDLTGVGKFNIGTLILCQFICVGAIMETLGFSYVLPASQCDLDLNMAERGWIATIPFMTIIVSSNIWGWYADAYGRKRAIIISTAVGSTFSILSSFMPELISFALVRVLAGLFISGCSSLVITYLGEVTPNRVRDKIMLLGNSALTLGTAFVPLISWGILPLDFIWPIPLFGYDYRPWRLLICCFAMPCAISMFIILKVPESPKFLFTKGRHNEALAVLRQIYEMNTGRPGSDYTVLSLAENVSSSDDPENQNMWKATVKLFSSPHLSKTLLFSLLQFTNIGVNNGFYIWMPDVINRVVNNPSVQSENMCSILNSVTNESQVEGWIGNDTMVLALESCDDSLNTAAFTYSILVGLAATVFGIITAFCLRIIGKRLQLTIILTFIGAIGVSINWVYEPVLSLVFFLSYQFMGSCIGLGNAFVVEYYPTSIMATGVGVTMMIGRIGSVVSTNLIGALINISCPTTFYLFSGLLFVVAVSTLFFPKDEKNQKKPIKDEK